MVRGPFQSDSAITYGPTPLKEEENDIFLSPKMSLSVGELSDVSGPMSPPCLKDERPRTVTEGLHSANAQEYVSWFFSYIKPSQEPHLQKIN